MTTVFHKLFGEGEVIKEDEKTITIDFETKGEKKMLKGASLVLYSSEEEMEEVLEREEMEEEERKSELDKPISQKNEDGETIYEIRKRLERKNLPSSMR